MFEKKAMMGLDDRTTILHPGRLEEVCAESEPHYFMSDVPRLVALGATLMLEAVAMVVKAGGAFGHVDPTYPSERLSFMLEDALAPAASLTANALREMLAQSLPDYMISVLFVQLDALPLAHNGKVDPAVLPLPDASIMLREVALMPATTPVEEWLAITVATLLVLPQVNVESLHDATKCNISQMNHTSRRCIQIVEEGKMMTFSTPLSNAKGKHKPPLSLYLLLDRDVPANPYPLYSRLHGLKALPVTF